MGKHHYGNNLNLPTAFNNPHHQHQNHHNHHNHNHHNHNHHNQDFVRNEIIEENKIQNLSSKVVDSNSDSNPKYNHQPQTQPTSNCNTNDNLKQHYSTKETSHTENDKKLIFDTHDHLLTTEEARVNNLLKSLKEKGSDDGILFRKETLPKETAENISKLFNHQQQFQHQIEDPRNQLPNNQYPLNMHKQMLSEETPKNYKSISCNTQTNHTTKQKTLTSTTTMMTMNNSTNNYNHQAQVHKSTMGISNSQKDKPMKKSSKTVPDDPIYGNSQPSTKRHLGGSNLRSYLENSDNHMISPRENFTKKYNKSGGNHVTLNEITGGTPMKKRPFKDRTATKSKVGDCSKGSGSRSVTNKSMGRLTSGISTKKNQHIYITGNAINMTTMNKNINNSTNSAGSNIGDLSGHHHTKYDRDSKFKNIHRDIVTNTNVLGTSTSGSISTNPNLLSKSQEKNTSTSYANHKALGKSRDSEKKDPNIFNQLVKVT